MVEFSMDGRTDASIHSIRNFNKLYSFVALLIEPLSSN